MYKMNHLGFDLIDVEKLNWKSKFSRNNTMFFDDDDDPLNGEMVLFHKTDYNRYEISTIKCTLPSMST